MKISKSSKLVWLIKLNYQIPNNEAYDLMEENWARPRKGKIKSNLCGFFWQTVGAILLCLVNVIGITVTLLNPDERKDPGNKNTFGNPGFWTVMQILALFIGGIITFKGFMFNNSNPWNWLFALVLGFVCLLLIIGFVALIISIGGRIDDYFTDKKYKKWEAKERAKRNPQPVENINPSFFTLVGQFLKAKKQKVCPRIEFIEEVKS